MSTALEKKCQDTEKNVAPEIKGRLIDELEGLCDQDIFGCYQCGTCAAGCPFVEEMDLTPDEVLRFVILDKKEVLNSKTIWLCSSCFACAERCPRDINITVVMEGLRQLILRKNVDETDIECLTEEDKRKIPQIAFVSLFRKNIG
jgi:heterodisulfide reductase subunit C